MRARTHASVPWEAYIVCVCVCCAVKMDQQKCLLRTFCVCAHAGRQAGTHARVRATLLRLSAPANPVLHIHTQTQTYYMLLSVRLPRHTHTFEICVGARAEHLPNSGSGSNNCLARHAQTTCNATHRALFSTHMQHDEQQRRSSAR